MGNKLTYKEAYDKIIDAYFKNEIKPLNASFCFCGTLCGSNDWARLFPNDRPLVYSYYEYGRMEQALFTGFESIEWVMLGMVNGDIEFDNYEEKLFKGMCAALDVLKQIHLERGEIIDEPIKFKKRELLRL